MGRIIKGFGVLGYTVPLLSFAILVYLWSTTNPATIGPAGMLLVFLLLYIFWASLFFIVLRLVSHLLPRGTGGTVFFIPRLKIRHQQSYYIASILAFIPVLLLAMQSVNQLTLRDIFLVFVFVSLAIFYVLKRS